MANKKLMILGLGGVGSYAAILAGRFPGVDIYLGDYNGEHAQRFAQTVKHDVYFQGDSFKFPKVEGFGIDMKNTSEIEKALERYQPDVIFNATTLLSWWQVHLLPHHYARKLYYAAPEGTGLRPWAPGHGALLYNLMKSVKKISPSTQVVNVSGPDYMHECLGKIGLAPATGVGNISLFEPCIKQMIANKRNTSMTSIDVTLVMHHIMLMPIFQEGACTANLPFYLKIEEDGKDITSEYDIAKDIWPNVPANMPVMDGVNQHVVAATAMQVVKSMLYDLGLVLHAPGANGLPGGGPIRVGADGVKTIIPAGLTPEEFNDIIYTSNKLEGFGPTQDDGTMTATPECVQIIEELFESEWKYKSVKPEDFIAAHEEISQKFTVFLEKCKKEA